MANSDDPNALDHLEPDPLLDPGAFIDPTSNGNGGYHHSPDGDPQPSDQVPSPSTPIHNPEGSDHGGESQPPPSSGGGTLSAVPDWLPPGWRMVERVRASGATAGTKDKYYMDPVSNRVFRSKKEVLFFLETGSKRGKKKADSDAAVTPSSNSRTPKRKKTDSKTNSMLKNFNFNDAPKKVKWGLIDVFEGSWRPLVNDSERVPESAKQEWGAAFTYLTLQNNEKTAS